MPRMKKNQKATTISMGKSRLSKRELTMLLLVGGLALLVFTREEDEETCSAERQELYRRLRGAALMKAMFYNTLFLLFCILFIYGQGFLAVVLINLVSGPVLYLVVFRLLLKKAGLRKVS